MLSSDIEQHGTGPDFGSGAYQVVSVVGPTASGKSAVADMLAMRLGSEVISADAMQVYRGMDIGTAKMPPKERNVPLRCIDLVESGEPYSVALYAAEAHRAIDAVCERSAVPVVCGGTGLYVRAALEEMDFPAGEQLGNPVRERYERMLADMGPELLHQRLRECDPQSAGLIHPNNTRRVVRAFELLEQGTSYAAEHATLHVRVDRRPTLHVGLLVDRQLLYKRINNRVDAMVADGLIDEVKSLLSSGFAETPTASQAIGYKEIISVMQGDISLEEAIGAVKQATRRYAKRQMTWFKADGRIHWIEASDGDVARIVEEIAALLDAQ